MRISNEVRRAILKAISDVGTQRKFAEIIGVAPSTISYWIAGQAENIRHAHWVKINELLNNRYPDLVITDEMGNKTIVEMKTTPYDADNVSRPDPDEYTRVPVLGMAAAAGFAPAVEPLDDYVTGCGADTHKFAGDFSENAFALRVDGQSMSPFLPNGTLLLVDPGAPVQPGNIVVARLSDHGEVICKRYYRKNGEISLESLNEDGKDYVIDIRRDPTRIVWMYPVRRAEIDLVNQQWQMARPKRRDA